jgi:glycosyltransferase involved in cell wall biosynthesis
VDRFLVVSDILKEKMIQQQNIVAEKVTKIYNGVEINYYLPDKNDGSSEKLRSEYGVEKEAVLVGAIGRFVWQKGFEYLIKALPDLLKIPNTIKVLLVGEGPLRIELEALADRLGLKDHIVFGGFRSDIKEILSAIDILVIPSLLEGFPMITLEAMAMAKPIVATSLPGILEQIEHERTGIIVSPENPVALSQGISDLIKKKEKAAKLGHNARDHVVENFSIEKMITKTEEVYQDLLAD